MQLNRRHPGRIRSLCGDLKRLSCGGLPRSGGYLPNLRGGIRDKDGVAFAGRRGGCRRGRRWDQQHRVDGEVAAAQRRVDYVNGDDVVAHFQKGTRVGKVDEFPLVLVVGDAAG